MQAGWRLGVRWGARTGQLETKGMVRAQESDRPGFKFRPSPPVVESLDRSFTVSETLVYLKIGTINTSLSGEG